MNEKNIQPASTSTADLSTPAATAPTRRRFSVSGGLALILSLIAFSATAYLWYVLKEKEGLLKGDVIGQLEQLNTSGLAMRSTVSTLTEEVAEVRETQDTLRAAVEKISADFGRARGEWMLAEAEQLLFIANHRLQLAQDVKLALAALRAADRQLKQVANPNLLPVRRLLSQEIAQLEAMNNIDFDGLALRLNTIAGKIDTLPLASETTFKASTPAPGAAPATGSTWSRFWQEFWADLRSLIRIRDDADVRQPLLAPEHQYFLRENLRLMLYSAQLALLQRDEGIFQSNLRSARKWLKDYFDTNTTVVAGNIDELDRMSKTSLQMRTPDISSSLTALQKITGRYSSP